MSSTRIKHAAYLLTCSIILNIHMTETRIHFKSLVCEPMTKVETLICRINAVNRDYNTITMKFMPKEQINAIRLMVKFFKRANGWHPFLFDFDLDVCAFFVRKQNTVMRWFFNQIKDFTNINHTCPYNHTLLFDGFYLNYNTLAMPIVKSAYFVDITLFGNGMRYGRINFTLEVS